MKRIFQPPPLLLLSIFSLGVDCVLSFTGIDMFTCRCRHAPSLYANNDDDDDHKIDWTPESKPKIAEPPSYSDNWLLNFHNWDQSEKQLVTNSLAKWNEEIRNEQATIIEWQDSFQRNDLADFTPPMSNGLNCLMVGDDFDTVDDNQDGTRRVKLPWEEEPEAQITSLRVLEESVEGTVEVNLVTKMDKNDETAVAMKGENENSDDEINNDDDSDDVVITVNSDDDENMKGEQLTLSAESMCGTNGGMVRTEVVPGSSPQSSSIRVLDSNKRAAVYDCIVDQGLMGRILPLENNNETVRELLEEAAVAIKDLGIYVLVTKELTEDSKRILEDYGLKAGLEWQFELDGISDDTQVVSVARRFCTGEMPKVGRLSRYQPEMPW